MSSETEAAAQALVTLRTRVDTHFEAALSRSPEAMQCKAGCDRCCHVDLTVFDLEAAPIREALSALPDDIREAVRSQASQSEHCAMLLRGRCAVYEQRPMICRSHGAPLLVESEGEAHVENCVLNFTQSDPPRASLLRLEAINQPLSVMASMWGGERVALRDLAGES